MHPWHMLDLLRAALAALEAEDALVQQRGDTWHEAERALSPDDEAEHEAHLAWSIIPEVWRPVGDQAIGGAALDELDLSVRWTYRVRPDDEQTDLLLALRSADGLCREVAREAWAQGGATVRTLQKARIIPLPGQPYVGVEARFTLSFFPGE